MIGIVSYGGYIPRLRMDRMAIFRNMGWLAPAVIMVAQGERSFCNWDEDSVTMAVEASRDCLRGFDKSAVDAHYLCSTTLPFADRLSAGIVKTVLNLRDDIVTEDFTNSLRCGTSALVTALDVVKGGGKKKILLTATDKRETRAGYFYEMWFGDGAASLLVGDGDPVAEFLGSYSVSYDFVDHYRGADRRYDYMWEERWVRDEGYAKIIPEAVSGLLQKLSITMEDVDTLVFPCFFKTEHRNIARKLGATPDKVMDNLHEVCGETGAAHPLVMFVHALEKARPGDHILLASFGQGCDALCFRVTEHIRKLPPRVGIRGSLERKLTTENYLKFLKFRDLIQTEMGIRAEAPMQTSLTVLWRKRKMILGLVGGKCRKCGTAQFPRMSICVNPDCKAVDSQDEYEFADRSAFVKSFTGDLLSVSVDPPAVYGMIQFEGGGRMMADFTDCEMGEVRVGQKVALNFRKRYTDRERSFSGYFWKAVPLRDAAPAKEGISEIRFDGRVAIVTGAGAGLGRVYALELAGRGAKVVVNDLGGAKDGVGDGERRVADRVVDEIRAMGGEAVASYESVASEEGGRRIVEKAVEAFGRVDIVVNNAGILRDKTLVKMEPSEWDAVMDVHLKGAYHVTRPAFLRMREAGYGRIVFTSSAAGLYGNFGQTNYSAAKMGLVGFMNTLKLEGERHGIKVNTVVPLAGTRLTDGVLPAEMHERLKPEFVAPLVLYLCSEACEENGGMFNAGMGYFNRAAIVTGPVTVIGDGKRVPAPEEIHKNWDAINRMTGAREYPNAVAVYAPMLEAFGPKAGEGGGGGELTVKGVFERIPGAFQAEKAVGVEVVFQFVLSGTEGGSWHVVVKGGKCEVGEGPHERPTTTIRMAGEDFVKLIRGELNSMKAYTTGKLKIEGDLMKSQLIEKLFKF